jgi:hypothetical protein
MLRYEEIVMSKKASKTPTRQTGIGRPFASEPISRRSFIKGSTVLGLSSILAGSAFGWMTKLSLAQTGIDIAAVKGSDYFKNTIKAVETLGGMGKFVSSQSRVGLLINSPWRHPGSYVTPEITLAVVRKHRAFHLDLHGVSLVRKCLPVTGARPVVFRIRFSRHDAAADGFFDRSLQLRLHALPGYLPERRPASADYGKEEAYPAGRGDVHQRKLCGPHGQNELRRVFGALPRKSGEDGAVPEHGEQTACDPQSESRPLHRLRRMRTRLSHETVQGHLCRRQPGP